MKNAMSDATGNQLPGIPWTALAADTYYAGYVAGQKAGGGRATRDTTGKRAGRRT